MPDVNNLVKNMVSADYSDGDIIDAVEVSYYYCSSVFGSDIPVAGAVGTNAITVDDNQQAMAISLLGEAILIENRKVLHGRNNPNLTVRSTNELFTQEMRNMLIVADASDPDEVAKNRMWSNQNPTSPWDAGSNPNQLF